MVEIKTELQLQESPMLIAEPSTLAFRATCEREAHFFSKELEVLERHGIPGGTLAHVGVYDIRGTLLGSLL